jgi:hypothetical protein
MTKNDFSQKYFSTQNFVQKQRGKLGEIIQSENGEGRKEICLSVYDGDHQWCELSKFFAFFTGFVSGWSLGDLEYYITKATCLHFSSSCRS